MNLRNKPDDLTGLHTRGILEELDLKFSAVAGKDVWSLMIIDIDHFKLVNDVYGHLAGDRVLRRVANILARNCRSTDTPLRYGGDEFVIVMPHTGQLEAVNQAERILQGLTREVFSAGMEVGLSIGVAENKPEDIHLVEIFERADNALYEAKKGGRGRVSFHKSNRPEDTKREISFEHFVGRQHELSTLRGILDETITGKGNFVLISGEPGIGKSRLAEELEHYSSFKNCLFLKTRCDELGTERPYRQITIPMAHHLLTLASEDIKNLKKKLPEVLPQTAELFPELNLKQSPSPVTDKDGVVRFRIYSEISLILRWIATRQPVVFTVDNLHWISEHNLDLLAYLVRATTDIPMLFLSISRPPGNFPEIQKKIRILASLVQFTSVKLDILDEEYTRHMVMFALRDPKIPQDVLQKLVTQSSGNPLYLKELLISLHCNGAIQPIAGGGWTYQITSDLPLPKTVSQLMAARLEKIDGFAKEVLCVGSLMPGGTFSLGPICAVLQKEELDMAAALKEPLRRGLIQENLSVSNTPEYRFIHETMRSFLYHELTPGTRKALQSRFGLYYENIRDSSSSDITPLIAHHYCDSMNSTKARHFALLAEAQANQRDAKREALRWLEQYMSFTGSENENPEEAFHARLELGKLYILFANHEKAARTLGDAAKYTTEKNQIGLLRLHEAQLSYNMGNYSTANNLFEAAIDLLPPGKNRIFANLQIAFIQYLSGSKEKGLKLLENVLNNIQTIKDDRVKRQLLATYHMRHSTITLNTISPVSSTEECMKAVAIYRDLSDKIGEARALLNTAVSLFATCRYNDRIDILNDALKVLMQTGDTHAIMGAYINLGQAYNNAMEYDLSRDYFEKCLRLVEATGTKRFGVWANLYLGILDTKDNNYPAAESRFRKTIELADELGLAPMAINARMNFVAMLLRNGDFQQADSLLSQLEADEVIKTLDNRTIRILRGNRGTERMMNTTLERTSALDQAEASLRNAISFTGNEPSLEDLHLFGLLAECLYEQNRLNESRNTLVKAQSMLHTHLSRIENNHYRNTVLNSETVKKLNNLNKLFGDNKFT